jgi:uracil-DNA glycosylase family 4
VTTRTSPHPSPLDTYLEWQADIGTADVVMSEPWAKPAARMTAQSPNDPVDVEEAPAAPRMSASPAKSATSPAPEDFFRDIQKRLAEPARKPAAPKVAPVAVSPAPRPASSVPAFASLEEYWTWLATEYPRWFPASSTSLVRGSGTAGAKLAVVELFPAGGALFGGDASEAKLLLDKMMQAIGLSREALYLTSVMKTPPAGKAWARKDIALALPSFLAELRLAGCGSALLLGEGCAQAVLRTGKSLSALEAMEETNADGTSVACVAAWHPADLLRDASLKAPAWARLKNLKSHLDRSEGKSS